MAGNNSCGSRSIAYGNMVHNVLGVGAWLSDGELRRFRTGPERSPAAPRKSRSSCASSRRGIAERSSERWPKVMRRVGGYNLDIFHNQSERPYTRTASVNLAHLLVGSEGTLAYTRNFDVAALRRCRATGSWASSIFRLSAPPCRLRSTSSSSGRARWS